MELVWPSVGDLLSLFLLIAALLRFCLEHAKPQISGCNEWFRPAVSSIFH